MSILKLNGFQTLSSSLNWRIVIYKQNEKTNLEQKNKYRWLHLKTGLTKIKRLVVINFLQLLEVLRRTKSAYDSFLLPIQR